MRLLFSFQASHSSKTLPLIKVLAEVEVMTVENVSASVDSQQPPLSRSELDSSGSIPRLSLSPRLASDVSAAGGGGRPGCHL